MKKCGIYTTYPKNKGDIEGGLRLQGKYKTDSDDFPLVTYITVVYNRVKWLYACMESVWKQNYPNIEYIIIDGNSTDGTVQLLLDNEDKIDYFISQPDNGIYNAMNKGFSLANGRLICFMNSDDQCMPDAAEKVVDLYLKSGADVVCGCRQLIRNHKRIYEMVYPRYCIKECVFRYIQMFHQSTYVSPAVVDALGYFDEQYPLLGDWVWEAKIIDYNFKIIFTEHELSIFNCDGASSQGLVQRDEEWEMWVGKNFPKIKKKDVKLLINCLDRDRHPLFDLKMLNKTAYVYFDNEDFKKVYYSTVLLVCIEQCTDIALMGRDKERYIEAELQKFKIKDIFHVNNFKELAARIDEDLRIVCEDNTNKEITKKDMEKIVPLRLCLNHIFYHLYMNERQEIDSSRLNRLFRISVFTLSKIVSKNTFLSRRFYPFIRACIVLQGKIYRKLYG